MDSLACQGFRRADRELALGELAKQVRALAPKYLWGGKFAGKELPEKQKRQLNR